MGTNFYFVEKKSCLTCGKEKKNYLHIGKSSYGWCFSLRIYPDKGIHSFMDWLRLFLEPGAEVFDEYNNPVTIERMISEIACRSGSTPFEDRDRVSYYPYKSEEEFHRWNGSERGPNGLLRATKGDLCVGHGEGPWDYFDGEFS